MENWHVFENYEKKIFRKYYMHKNYIRSGRTFLDLILSDDELQKITIGNSIWVKEVMRTEASAHVKPYTPV